MDKDGDDDTHIHACTPVMFTLCSCRQVSNVRLPMCDIVCYNVQVDMEKRNTELVRAYVSGLPASKVASMYGVTERQVQRLVHKAGKSRTISQSFILAISDGRMKYHYKPAHLKAKRKTLTLKTRFLILTRDSYKCVLCGKTAKECHRLEIDHIDNNATNNDPSNLQTLCDLCNKGKAYNKPSPL